MLNKIWTFKNSPFVFDDIKHKKFYGFIYIITNNIDNRKYIGKKSFWSRSYTNWCMSNWKDYYGSSKELSNDIKLYGKNQFTRTILSLHENKKDLDYYETKYLFTYNALENMDFYNSNICGLYFNKDIRNINNRSLF